MELKTKTFVFILVSFLLGGIAGGFIGRTYFASQPNAHRPSRAEVQKQFAERLKLSPAQATQVDSVFESFRQKFGEVQKGYSQAFQSKRDTLRLTIRKLLTEEQNKLYDDYIKEMDEREAKRRGNHSK
jgi:uncharacterized protein YneF (UPF0154 family)